MTDIATFAKNTREEVRVTLDDFKGHRLINVRVWFRADDDTMRPGKQGIALRLEQLPDLMAALASVNERTAA